MKPEEDKAAEFEDGFLSADIQVEDQAYGSIYPLIQWVNGDPTKKALGLKDIAFTGGWFMSADQGLEPPKGFAPYTLMTSKGEEVEGFSCRDLTFSPIRDRRCWVVSSDDDNGFDERFAQNDYDTAKAVGNPKGLAHLVVGIEDVDEPVMLSFKGMAAKSMFSRGKVNGIIPNYSNKILRAAKRLARQAKQKGKDGKGKSYPLCAFRCTVGPDRDAKGDPIHTEVGSGANTSKITLPSWLDEPKKLVGKAEIVRLYVGAEMLGEYQDIHRECDDWREQWSPETIAAIRAKREGTAAAAPVQAAGSEADLPGDQEMGF